MKTTWMVLCAALLVAGAGCQGGKNNDKAQTTDNQTQTDRPDVAQNMDQGSSEGMTGETPEPEKTIETQKTPEPAPPKPTPAKPKPAPTPAEVTVPAGTIVKATLNQDLASHQSKAGDTFTMRVSEPVIIAGYTAIPAGSTINGTVVEAQPSGKIKGRGDITLAFTSVTDANGNTHDIQAENFYGQAEGAGDRDAATIAGGAGAGAIIGGIVGGKKGALLGGLIGGAAGTGTVLATSGPQVKIASGSEFAVKLNTSLYLPAGPKIEG